MDDNVKDSLKDEQEEIQEGEVVSSDIQTAQGAQSAADTSATILESLESLIRENLVRVAKLSEELKQQKEMVDSVLENDETYKLHAEAAKQAAKTKSATKNEISKRSDVAHIVEKIKELVSEIKEIKESMSSYLQEYQRLSGVNEINDENGEPMQIVYTARLVKRRT